jgi:hypothetical protein
MEGEKASFVMAGSDNPILDPALLNSFAVGPEWFSSGLRTVFILNIHSKISLKEANLRDGLKRK